MPTITHTRYITEEQYIGHQLTKLASCHKVLPRWFVLSMASKIIGNRFDREEWFKKFTDKCEGEDNDR